MVMGGVRLERRLEWEAKVDLKTFANFDRAEAAGAESDRGVVARAFVHCG